MAIDPHPLLAVGGFDLIGVVFFIIIAIISAISKGRGEEEDTPSRPIRRVPPPMPEGTEEPDLAGQMKRFLEEARSMQRQYSPPPLPLPLRVPISSPRRTEPAPRAARVSVVRPPVPVSILEEEQQEGPHTGPLVALHASGLLSSSLSEASGEQAPEVPPEPALVSMAQMSSARAAFQFDPSKLRSLAELRQALVANEILGRPRAFTM